MKKTMLVSLVVAAACSMAATTFAAMPDSQKIVTVKDVSFSDIAGHWAEVSIKGAVAKGYVDGYEDGTFRPENNVSRAEFVKMAVTALKLNVAPAAKDSAWYTSYVNAATTAGILRSSDFADDNWNAPITRLEMSRISLRASDKSLQPTSVLLDEGSLVFKAAQKGLIQGMDDTGTLGLDQVTTRAQSVTIIERILTVAGGGTLSVDKHAVSRAEVAWHKTNIFTVMPQFFGGSTTWTKWDPENLFVQTGDGNYKGVLDELLAIDLEDPNDPYRSELPDLDTLKWDNLRQGIPLKGYTHSYVLLSKNHVEYNHDTSIYVQDTLSIGVLGIKMPDVKAFESGDLNSIASLYSTNDPKLEFRTFLFPKEGLKTDGSIKLYLYAPALPPANDFSKTILDVSVPAEIK